MKKPFRKSIFLFLILICFIAQIFFVLKYFDESKKLVNINKEIKHNYDVIQTAEQILNNLNLAISKERGFLLTNNKAMKTDYENAITGLYENLKDLKTINVTGQISLDKIDQLEKSISNRTQFFSKLNQVSTTKGIKATLQMINREKDQFYFDEPRSLIAIIIGEQKINLNQRNFKALKDTNMAIHSAIYENIATFFLMILCFSLLYYQLKRHQKMHQKLKTSREELYKLAYFNPLTELPNRAFLSQKINNLLEANLKNEITALHLNIDDFKNINNSFSYEFGSNILKLFADRLKKLTNENIFLAHFGSDEFVFLAINQNHLDILKMIQTILSIGQNIELDNHHLSLTMGLGIYSNNSNDNSNSILKNASLAMHTAKEQGRNAYQFCSPTLQKEVEENGRLSHYLHRAIKQNEFVLFYQPKINVESEEPMGVEVLIRWIRNGETISPARFISLAEKNGTIIEMSEWMIKTACLQMKKWLDDGVKIKNIALNISPVLIQQTDLVEKFKSILSETKLPSHYVELELTESVLIKNTNTVIEIIKQLKSLGVHISIDDFGTGFSSLSYFRFLQIDKLKIDQAFIKEINRSDQQSPIIHAVILMSHSLGIHVIGEGVETREQVEFLKKAKCDEAQGYYYSKPIEAKAIPAFFAKDILGKYES